MKIIVVELTDDVYDDLRKEAEGNHCSIADLIRQRIEPSSAAERALEKWSFKPVNMGGPFLFPPERWRELPDEDRVA